MKVRKGFLKDYLFIDEETNEKIDIGYKIPINVHCYIQFDEQNRIDRWLIFEKYPYDNKIGQKE